MRSVDTVTDVVVDAKGAVTPLSKGAAKELRRLEKRLTSARKTEAKRLKSARRRPRVEGSQGDHQASQAGRRGGGGGRRARCQDRGPCRVGRRLGEEHRRRRSQGRGIRGRPGRSGRDAGPGEDRCDVELGSKDRRGRPQRGTESADRQRPPSPQLPPRAAGKARTKTRRDRPQAGDDQAAAASQAGGSRQASGDGQARAAKPAAQAGGNEQARRRQAGRSQRRRPSRPRPNPPPQAGRDVQASHHKAGRDHHQARAEATTKPAAAPRSASTRTPARRSLRPASGGADDAPA